MTDVKRRVTSWEHEAKETLSDLINIGVVIKGPEKGGFRDNSLINTAYTTEWNTFVNYIEIAELARKSVRNVLTHGERLPKES